MVSRQWYSRMAARDTEEHHRVATPLELLFDLCFVVAVARAAAQLDHELAAGHLDLAVGNYVMVFFAIWWAWMNFTWFASAYDTDDGIYRLTTLVQITGVLVLAAGVTRATEYADFRIITFGYVIMRLALVGQWLRAAHGDPARRPAALRFAVGIGVLQIGWVLRLALPPQWGLASFVLLGIGELSVPVWAERAARTTWHPHHIVERYGLFTLIVLGESVLSATTAIQSALDTGHHLVGALTVAGSGLVIVFALWWKYFDRSAAGRLTSLRRGIVWGYGHYLVFASAAAVGAGLAVSVDRLTGAASISARVAGYAVAVPVCVYVLSVWLLHWRGSRRAVLTVPVATALILLAPLTPVPLPMVAVVLAGLVALSAGREHDVAPKLSSAG
jgi:low temperature requirement protein LtrA